MAQAGHGTARSQHTGALLSAVGLLIVASLALAASAAAELTGNFARFASCPYKDPTASKCILATTEGGEVVLGSRKVPIVKPAVLQGAVTSPGKDGFSNFIAATDGETFATEPQPVPGGLAGIVPPEGSSSLVKAVVALFSENALTRVSATLELARPVSEIRFNEANLAGELGPALRLPLKIHLENPLLGPSCYVGSSSAPIYWNLSSGKTSPPAPSKPIAGTVGEAEFLEEGSLLEAKGTTLVDNAWQAPLANGCGSFLSSLINPIVNSYGGLPAAAGKNVAILNSSGFITAAAAVKINNGEKP
jgi:hypothetical protein